MAYGYWEVDVPVKDNASCRHCSGSIGAGHLRFQWFEIEGPDRRQKTYFHSNCALAAGANGEDFAKVCRANIRRSIGLFKQQRAELDSLLGGSESKCHAAPSLVLAARTQVAIGSSKSVGSNGTIGSASDPMSLTPLSPKISGFLFDLVEDGKLRVSLKSDDALSVSHRERMDTWPELKRQPGEVAWLLSVSDFHLLLGRITGKHELGGVVPKWVLDAWAAALRLASGATAKRETLRYDRETPPAVKRRIGELMPYQRDAVQFGISHSGRVLCGDEMGLGKTLTALALACEYRDEWPALVVCPAMLRHQWEDQILHWLGHMVEENDVQVISKGGESIEKNSKFVVVSYGLVSKDAFQGEYRGIDFKVVICDESHYIKEHTSKRTEACLQLLERAKRVVLLSGTPALNTSTELHPQLQAVLGEPPSTFQNFASRYAYKKTFRVGRRHFERWAGFRREAELGILLRALMIRRRKDEVMKQLPELRRQRVVIAASDPCLRSEHSYLEDMDQEGLPQAFKNLCKSKVKDTETYLGCFLEGLTSKALLFAHHHVMLDAIQRALVAQKIKFIRIDGKTPAGKRSKALEHFRKDDAVKCAILSITVCGVGIDLSCATVVVFCELYWVPGVMEQCESRAHRKGQKSMVDVQYLVVKGSIDECAFRSICRKKQLVGAVLDGAADQLDATTVSAQRCLAAVRKRPAGQDRVTCAKKRKDE